MKLHKRRVVVHFCRHNQSPHTVDAWPGDRIIASNGREYTMLSTGVVVAAPLEDHGCTHNPPVPGAAPLW